MEEILGGPVITLRSHLVCHYNRNSTKFCNWPTDVKKIVSVDWEKQSAARSSKNKKVKRDTMSLRSGSSGKGIGRYMGGQRFKFQWGGTNCLLNWLIMLTSQNEKLKGYDPHLIKEICQPSECCLGGPWSYSLKKRWKMFKYQQNSKAIPIDAISSGWHWGLT